LSLSVRRARSSTSDSAAGLQQTIPVVSDVDERARLTESDNHAVLEHDPDSYGRVIEALGRQHRVDEVRKVYLIAYQALTAMSEGAQPACSKRSRWCPTSTSAPA
jgi:hypothetical protein